MVARSKRSMVLAGAGVVVLMAGAFFAGRSGSAEPSATLARFEVQVPEQVISISSCCGPQQALSPDGEWLAFRGGVGSRCSLYRRRLGQLEAEEIPGTSGATLPFFSYDGRWLGFHSEGQLRKVPTSGGPPVPIARVAAVDGASWGDNDVIVFAQFEEGGLYTVPGSGGEPTLVPGTEERGYVHPSALPGGEAAVMRIDGTGPAPEDQFVVVDLSTGAADTLGFGTRVAYASGYIVFSGTDGTLQAQPFDPRARRITGPAVAILDGVRVAGPDMREFALSAQGGMAYQSARAGAAESLIITGPSGSSSVPLVNARNLEDPAFSPDGRRIAIRLNEVEDTDDIWIWDRDQQTLARLTTEGGVNVSPVWTHDGARIAFGSDWDNRGGENQMYWQPSDFSGAAERLLEKDFYANPVSWSPDDQTLAFIAYRENNFDIGLLTPGDSTPRWLLPSEFNESQPQWSPDGQWLAYSSDRSGTQEVYVQAVATAGVIPTVSTNGGSSPRWSPTKNELYYVPAPGTVMAATFSTENGFRVTGRTEAFNGVDDVNPVVSINYDVAPDGGEEFVHITHESTGSSLSLVWILNWPEIVRGMTSCR